VKLKIEDETTANDIGVI